MYYEIKATGNDKEVTFKSNDILEVLPRLRDLWNEDFHRIDLVDFTGSVHFHYEDGEEDVFMSSEMKLMWMGFFFSPLAGW